MDITQAKVVVTGGASGLGAATAAHFAERGAAVTVFDRDPAGADRAAAFGAGFAEVDVTDEASVRAGFDHAVARMGGLTCAISCAGIATAERTMGRKGPHALESFERTISINLTGSFNIARLASEIMSDNDIDESGERGVVINTASVAAFDGQKGQAAYAASKGGVAALSLPLARDLGSLGIRAMAIAPGIFRTPMLESLGEEVMDGLAADVIHPKRLGMPEEFARLAAFIVECSYLNGTTIRLDGALRMP
ncbi:MAG: SDR family NAD(P)-dependent oxidoreductase [Pseudomonadota bacterium]